MNVGSLFSGIGGFDLGLQRAGMRTAFFAEREPYCRAVLRKHWPGVPILSDVRDVTPDSVPPVDLVCGGFPCQDLSYAGSGAGLDGARSGLWSEFHRIIGELRPRYVIVENVPGLRTRGLGRVLGEMAALGYDAEWDCIPASAVGAPHRRDRIWIVAYPNRGAVRQLAERDQRGQRLKPAPERMAGSLANAEQSRLEGLRAVAGEPHKPEPGNGGALADAEVERKRPGLCADQPSPFGRGRPSYGGGAVESHWLAEPDVGRVAYGVPSRVDRLRALGNALVPQIAEILGRRILDYEAAGEMSEAA